MADPSEEKSEMQVLQEKLKAMTRERDELKSQNASLQKTITQQLSLANRTSISSILLRSDLGAGLIGKTIGVAGWVKTLRDQKKFAFVELTDGSTSKGLQIIIEPSIVSNFDEIVGRNDCSKTDVGSSLFVRGTLVESPASGQVVECKALDVQILGRADPATYPLPKKRHTLEYLRSIAHLRARTDTIGGAQRVRNTLAFATHQFFQQNGFFYIHTPIITSSDCEGAGEMFQVTTMWNEDTLKDIKEGKPLDWSKDFFKRKTFLTVSGQLSAEAYACAMGKVYTFAPTFRAENANTSRHLSEFWMIEPELAFADLKEDMDVAEAYIKFVIGRALEDCDQDLAMFEQREKRSLQGKPKEEQQQNQWRKTLLRKRLRDIISSPFARITYTKAIDVLIKAMKKKKKFEVEPKWGVDLGSEHERYLCEVVYKKPVIVYDYPKEFKAFYMRQNEDGKTVRAMDILVPGVGELVGGSQREERLDVLEARMKELGMDLSLYEWYLDLRRFGSVPHSGFGLGFERLVNYVTGLDNIRDVIAFPRYSGHAQF